MNNIFFFQTQPISDDSSLFHQLKKQNIFFSYFLVEQKYYLFFYRETPIDRNFFYQSIDIIQELDSKKRKIRSLRGFLLYALEIMETGKEYEILNTNLQPFFWRKVKNIIRQNKKVAFQEFLFGKNEVNQDQTLGLIPHLEDQIKALNNQVDSLQDRISDLETKLFVLRTSHGASFEENPKYALRGTLQAPDDTKTIQRGDLKEDNGSYFQENHQGDKLDSKIISEDSKSPLKKAQQTKEHNHNPHLNQEKALNEPNFITLSKITEQEQIEIIQIGFQIQAEGKISLKKYYESTDPYSLFQLKRYNIKYESIRRTKLYQQLKF